jgi:predicted acylesterase/phospholipase RssA
MSYPAGRAHYAASVDPVHEEVRLAMVLNGGVSLAIWMGGCAVELDAARRAHLGPEPLDAGPLDPLANRASQPAAPRSVYHALCQVFDRNLVIDILTGASAGGINASLIAAATVGGRRLHPDLVRSKWLELGDFSKLLHNPSDPEPPALMKGELLHASLRATFAAILGEPDAEKDDLAFTKLPPSQRSAPPVGLDVPLVDIATTNPIGESVTFTDQWGEALATRDYRARFRFRAPADYSSVNLAAAARSSASFPFAFEPWVLTGKPRELAGLSSPRYVIDGGLLDNAPILAAIDLIPRRTATRPVRRVLCYVNPDPSSDLPSPEMASPPTVKDVIGYVMNLPRKAPFVDHLRAIQRAVRSPGLVEAVDVPLMKVSLRSLMATAGALLPAYWQRRAIPSLEELLDRPVDPVDISEKLVDRKLHLPWLPRRVEPPEAGTWSWGIRAAQRALHLLLDLLSAAGNQSRDDWERRQLLATGAEIEEHVVALDRLYERVLVDVDVRNAVGQVVAGDDESRAHARLETSFLPYAAGAYDRVRKGAHAFHAVLPVAEPHLEFPPGKALFGREWAPGESMSKEEFDCFLRRALAIEVVRRAYTSERAIDTSQGLRFGQITPFAPTPILWSDPLGQPTETRGPRGAEAKLTSIRLGHFAGFYRGSWRANDFMWGRLDAAARIIDLLIDSRRARQLDRRSFPGATALSLSDKLMPDGADETSRWLVHEALRSYEKEGRGTSDSDDSMTPEELPSVETLRSELARALTEDLKTPDAKLTRVVCARAVQLEILRAELPHLMEQSQGDAELGSFTPPLSLPSAGGMRAQIEDLRHGEILPKRLGRDDPQEPSSNLALQTLTRAALVTLSALRGVAPALGLAAGVVRPFLYAVAGVVSHGILRRAAVGIGFSAASWYLASRLVTTVPSEMGHDPEIGDAWSRPVFVSVVAILAVAGVASVPLFRVLQGRKRLRNVGLLLLVLTTAGAAGAVAAFATGYLDLADLILAPGAAAPPEWVLGLVILATLGVVVVRLPPILARLGKLLERPWSTITLVALVGLSGAVLWCSAAPLWEALADSPWWKPPTAALALFGAPILAISFLASRFVRALLAHPLPPSGPEQPSHSANA